MGHDWLKGVLLPPQLNRLSSSGYLEPNPYYATQLLKSLRKTVAGKTPGSIVSIDGMLSACREGAPLYKLTAQGQLFIDGWGSNVVRLDWRCKYDIGRHVCFWARQWRGSKGLKQRVKQYLQGIL